MWWVAMCWNVFHCFTISVQLTWPDIGESQNPPKNSRCAVCATIGWSRHVANRGNFSESRALHVWDHQGAGVLLVPPFVPGSCRLPAERMPDPWLGCLFRSVSRFFCFFKCNNASYMFQYMFLFIYSFISTNWMYIITKWHSGPKHFLDRVII